jgi:predicted neuraminidase
MKFHGTLFLALLWAAQGRASDPVPQRTKSPGVIDQKLVKCHEVHASTVAESNGVLVIAWFFGTSEGHPDVGICLVRKPKDGPWSRVVEVANGIQEDGRRYPCWNPTLFSPAKGSLLLFYKVGPSPRRWWTMLMISNDHGKTWSRPRRLPEGILGPVKNKPLLLDDGSLLCGTSKEPGPKDWQIYFDITPDLGKTWRSIGPLNDSTKFAAIQPTLLTHKDGKLQALCRTLQGVISEMWSSDGGKTWSAMTATALPNPDSGIDAVTLRDGRHLLVYNHTTTDRSPLNVAMSEDGKKWKAALVLEDQPGEYSYPAVIQTSDGLVHVTYTWKRERIKHVVLDPSKLELRDMKDGQWPKDAVRGGHEKRENATKER